MRLETDVTTATPPFDTFAPVETEIDKYEESREHLTAGIKAAQRGDRAQARTSLLRCTELDARNENAWLWLASISEYPEELLVFLNNVLEINPANTRALDWRTATNSLLAKTFVQRGIDAVEENQKDHASEYFSKALEYDQNNSLAWMWMASLSDSHDGQLLYLEKALAIDPENEAAINAHKAVKREITSRHLADAKTAAVSGRLGEANELLDAVLAEMPDSEEAWMLRSHFAVNFEEKIRSFERVVEINPNNLLASTSLESLRSLVMPQEVLPVVEQSTDLTEELPAPETLSFEPAFENTQPEMTAAFFEHYEKEAVEEANAQAESSFTAVTEETVVEEEATSYTSEVLDFAPVSSEEPTEFKFDSISSNEEKATDEYFATPVEKMMPVSLEVPKITQELVSDEEAVAEHFVTGPEMSSEDDRSVDLATSYENAEEAVSLSDQAFDDESIEETRPSYEAYVEETVSEPISKPLSMEFVSDEAQNGYENGNDTTFDPTLTYYSPSPVHFEPSTEPVVEEVSANELSSDDSSPLPFGNTLMFTLQADELKLKDEAVAISETADDRSEMPVFESSIPMPVSENGHSEDALAFSIPMPSVEPYVDPEVKTGFETTVMPQVAAAPEKKNCVFCDAANDNLAVSCQNCLAVLTLSDLEMVLSNQNADRNLVRDAVEKLETKKADVGLSEYEMTMLGIGYLNMKDIAKGHKRLSEASQMSPNNVILSSQVNALHIRLEEIRSKEEASDAMPKGKTILVVDDSPTIRKLISGKLEKCGHEVFCSADGVDAMEQLAVLQPDLILLDITMPRMDGYQVCKQIRSNDVTKDVPVVMISGKDGFFDKVRGRMAGSTGYITKPFGPETLMKIVETYLTDGH